MSKVHSFEIGTNYWSISADILPVLYGREKPIVIVGIGCMSQGGRSYTRSGACGEFSVAAGTPAYKAAEAYISSPSKEKAKHLCLLLTSCTQLTSEQAETYRALSAQLVAAIPGWIFSFGATTGPGWEVSSTAGMLAVTRNNNTYAAGVFSAPSEFGSVDTADEVLVALDCIYESQPDHAAADVLELFFTETRA